MLGIAGTAGAVPPPPPNPNGSDIAASRADAKAGKVGTLTNQLSEVESRLRRIVDEVALRQENANKALVDMRTAQDEASQSVAAALTAQARSATKTVEDARAHLDDFAESSLRQQRTIGSITAFIGAKSPKDVLARAGLLNAVSHSKQDALDEMQRTRSEKVTLDSLARAALHRAQCRQAAAEQAKRDAHAAKLAAIHAQQSQRSRANQLQAVRSDLRQQLTDAQGQVSGLGARRAEHRKWQAAKWAEDAANAHAAAASSGGGGSSVVAPAPASGSVEAVIARAVSALGTTYAWGGGNTSGPTYGIQDGGVADAYGDYNKIGYDCSGLMVYAFAAAGISLPHYSGYQYTAGTQVPLSRMRRGDMLFYGGAGGIHHVTLYLGNGRMIEAQQSGSYVQISPVRYGEIMPYATRML